MSSSSSLATGRSAGRSPDMTLIAPAADAEVIDASASDHAIAASAGAKGLYVGTAGNVKVQMAAGTDITFSNVVAGSILPIQYDIVYNSGTTASNMVALL